MGEDSEYDIFIAYANADAEYARKLYQLLSVDNLVFRDIEELEPGARFLPAIHEAQMASLVTVVLVSPGFDDAYFQKEEMLSGIDFSRKDDHRRVVPVYLTGRRGQIDIPSPLKQLHGIFLEEEGSLLAVAGKIEALAKSLWQRVNWQQQFNAQRTIIIVTGCDCGPELFDRPCAYRLKRAIERMKQPTGKNFLRVMVMGDIWFVHHSGITGHPNMISIGSPGMNMLSGLIAADPAILRIAEAQRWRILRSQNQWAVFGDRAEDTRAAVRSFQERNLPAFVQEVWSTAH